MGLFRGFLAPFRGAIYVARERLWRHLIVPIVLNLALGATTLFAAARFWRQDLDELLVKSPVIGWIFVFVMTGIGGVVLFILLQPLMNAIFCDRLAETVEKRVRGSAPAEPLFSSVVRALAHGLLKLVFFAVAMGVGLALTALTGVGSLVGIGLGAIFLAYDGFDYPLARRGATFAGKWAYLAKNPGLTIGYGLGSYVLYLVPLAFVVAPPFAAVGATLAYLEADERKTRRQKPSRNEAPAPDKAPAPDQAPSQENAKNESAATDDGDTGAQAHKPIDISAS